MLICSLCRKSKLQPYVCNTVWFSSSQVYSLLLKNIFAAMANIVLPTVYIPWLLQAPSEANDVMRCFPYGFN